MTRPKLPRRSAKRAGGRRVISPAEARAFDPVAAVGLTLPGVTAVTRYDGSPVLKAGGAFMAGLAADELAEPDREALRDLLAVSRRLTLAKSRGSA